MTTPEPITEARGVRKLIILLWLLFAFSPIGAAIDAIWWHFVGRYARSARGFK